MSLRVDHILLRSIKIKERETWEGRHEFQLSSFSYQIHLIALGVHIQEGRSSPTKMLHLNRCGLLPLSAEAQQLLQERVSNVPEPWTSHAHDARTVLRLLFVLRWCFLGPK